MNNIEFLLFRIINEQPLKPIVIAYSGGIDSQVLLHALAKLSDTNSISNPITVCHVNHGLSDNAQNWQKFAQQQCTQLNLPLAIREVKVKVQKQQSLEALARDARYKALIAINTEKSLIITGHHSDDQSETFLLALKRGAGLKGLSAMSNEMALSQHTLLRPLLNISRAEIEAYASSHGLSWVEDESNSDTSFDRNFIRQEVMPLLSRRWPSISNTINRSAAHCLEGQELLNELAMQDLAKAQLNSDSLHIPFLLTLSKARFNNLIRFFLAKHQCLMPSTEQLSQLRQQLDANTDKNPAVKVGDHFLRRYKESLSLTATFVDVSDWQQVINFSVDNTEGHFDDNTGDNTDDNNLGCKQSNNQGNCSDNSSNNNADKKAIEANQYKLPDNLGVLCISTSTLAKDIEQKVKLPEAGQVVTIRFSHNNPVCLPDYRKHSRSLKKVLQELNISPWQRKRTPFIYYDDTLVAAIGHFVCQAHQPDSDEPCVYVSIG